MKHIMIYLLYIALLNTALVLAGYVLVKKGMIWLSWVVLIASVGAIYLAVLHETPVLRMLAIITTTFTAMKVVAVTVSCQHKSRTLKFQQWLVFTVGWAGMRIQPFEALGGESLPDGWSMIRFGISRVIAGGLLLLVTHANALLPLNNQLRYVLISGLLLIGFSLILHFGLLSISAGIWRLRGVPAYYLFKQPAKARSLGEFWSKRWNLAFSEMTSITGFLTAQEKDR